MSYETRSLDETLCTRRHCNDKCFAVTNEPRKNEQRENRVCDLREERDEEKQEVETREGFERKFRPIIMSHSRVLQPTIHLSRLLRRLTEINATHIVQTLQFASWHSRKIVALSFSMRDIHSPMFNRARKMSTMSLQIYADVVMIRCASRDLPYTR